MNKTLETINLRLNSFSDKAGKKFFTDMMLNKTLKVIDLSGYFFYCKFF